MNLIFNFLRFSRLHTVIGTTLSISSLYLLAVSFTGLENFDPRLFLLTLVSCLGANIYIVGLNQLTDVEIDRINKPYLPLASGVYSMRTGYYITGISVMISLLIAFYLGQYLLLTVLLSLALGTAYSLPPLRLKRFHFWAAFCIIAVRGLIVNLLLFLHFYSNLGGSDHIPLSIRALTAAIFIYSIVIAWFKDIPDMEGDRQFRINTLTLRFGPWYVFYAGNAFLSAVCLLLILLPLLVDLQVSAMVMVAGHLALLLLLWTANRRVNFFRPASFARYYQFIWVLFFLEYLTFATAGLVYAFAR